jgi:DNA modification methylase
MEQIIIQGDCLEEMRKLEAGSVDLILTDPPYGTIKDLINPARPKSWGNKDYKSWDDVIDIEKMFNECNRILRKNGRLILFAQEPFTTDLINRKHNNLEFNYRAIWLKDNFSNALLVNKAMVIYTEDILIFTKRHDSNAKHPLRDYAQKIKKFIGYSRLRLFKEIGNGGAQHFLESNKESSQFCLCTEETYNRLIELYKIDKEDWFIPYYELKKINDDFCNSTFNLWNGKNYKSNVLEYAKDPNSKRLHPTQKPVELLKDLIKTYSNEGDVVLDFTAGSFSTLVACQQTNRKGIGIELEEKYVNIGRDRLKQKILSNSSPPIRTSNSMSLTSEEPKGFNKNYQETSSEVSQIPNGTSDNPDIIGNFKNPLVSREQLNKQGVTW